MLHNDEDCSQRNVPDKGTRETENWAIPYAAFEFSKYGSKFRVVCTRFHRKHFVINFLILAQTGTICRNDHKATTMRDLADLEVSARSAKERRTSDMLRHLWKGVSSQRKGPKRIKSLFSLYVFKRHDTGSKTRHMFTESRSPCRSFSCNFICLKS